MAISHLPAYDEFAEFIASAPTLKQVSELRFSDETEAHISYLLEGNRNDTLTPTEKNELDEYLRLEHIMRKAKIRAIQKLHQQAT